MIIIIRDNWLQEKECKELIQHYEANVKRVRQYESYYPLVLKPGEIPYLEKKFDDTAYKINKSSFEYCGITKWQPDTELKPHVDFALETKNGMDHGYILASVVYLNDDYKGGQTYIDDGTVIAPVQGRGLFFDGMHYKHGVFTIKNNVGYTITAWFKDKKDEKSR